MIEFRQRKVLISLTSYPQRFEFLPIVLKSIENESLLARKINSKGVYEERLS